MDVIVSTGAIEGYFGVRLASLILFHHYDPFPHSLALVSLHSDDFHDFELFWAIG
jgi:hypothetical protein